MRKFMSICLVLLLVFGSMPVFAADEFKNGGFTYTGDGTVTYYEDPYAYELYVPKELNGTAVKAVGDYAFGETGFEFVAMENGMERIGKSAFEHGMVNYLELPASVNYIDDRAFYRCEFLEEVFLLSDNIDFGRECFGQTGHIKFMVPCTSDTDKLAQRIKAAKGDGNFEFQLQHFNFREGSDLDINGFPVLYCTDCGELLSTPAENETYPEYQPETDIVEMNFYDVPRGEWFYNYVYTAFEFGIINGKGDGKFDPYAGMTLAEAAKIAACINNYQTQNGYVFQNEGSHWYDTYVNYCYNNGIIESSVKFDWNKKATRAEMAYIFSRCDTSPFYMNPDVPITDIPDVTGKTRFAHEILDLYRKGIAAGSDDKMTFHPDSDVKRNEAAAFISRILCYDMRIELARG